MNLFVFFMSISGIGLFIFGFRLLFQKGFVEKRRQGIWKPDNKEWSGKEGYFVDKYIRGLSYLVVGLLLLGVVVYSLMH